MDQVFEFMLAEQQKKILRDEYTLRDVEKEYEKWSEETRWQYEVY